MRLLKQKKELKNLKKVILMNDISDYDNKELNNIAIDLFNKSFQQCNDKERKEVMQYGK